LYFINRSDNQAKNFAAKKSRKREEKLPSKNLPQKLRDFCRSKLATEREQCLSIGSLRDTQLWSKKLFNLLES